MKDDITQDFNPELNHDFNTPANPELAYLVKFDYSERCLKFTFTNSQLVDTPKAVLEVYKHLLKMKSILNLEIIKQLLRWEIMNIRIES